MKYRPNDILVECEHGIFDHDCTETCGECVREEPCDPVSGTCPTGCGPGYKGNIETLKVITLYLIIICTYDRISWTVMS